VKAIQQLAGVVTRPTTSTEPNPLCAAKPDDWDLDIGTPDIWLEAVRTCHDCLILAQCRERVATLTGRGMPPRSMIWAGVAYDGFGKVIENLDRHHARPIEKRPPSRIVRIGSAYVRRAVEGGPEEESLSASPRRTVDVRGAVVGVDQVENLDRHRPRPIEKRPPSRIVRIGSAYVRPAVEGRPEEESLSASPRRTVDVRRAAVGVDQCRESVAVQGRAGVDHRR
jgi:hypothetical protein